MITLCLSTQTAPYNSHRRHCTADREPYSSLSTPVSNTTVSLPSTGSSEPGADEAADPASALLVVAGPATPLLVALGFPSKPLVVLLDHAERGVGRCGGRCMGRCRDVSLSSRPQRFYRKGTRRTRKNEEQRTNTKRKASTFWAVSSVHD